ncbi:butyrophilin-like protein 10 [Pelmatolapia mariae]|uniref:butyrophilin-like protein 10 n=1 Tax=Pelmatolapia mariae TaxID=158779 RepID=UPI003211E9E0
MARKGSTQCFTAPLQQHQVGAPMERVGGDVLEPSPVPEAENRLRQDRLSPYCPPAPAAARTGDAGGTPGSHPSDSSPAGRDRPARRRKTHGQLHDFVLAESQVVGPHQPVVALVDDDVILPCHVEPAEDVTAEILEWTRSDLDPRFVHVWRSGQDVVNARNPSYRGRTSLFINELKRGNISLKLSRVKLSDKGTYECQIPLMGKKSVVELVVGASTSPVIRLSGIDKSRGVVLQCESAGWYPEPELLWLDGEGNLLSAGPTETLRGPDDLYTVSSRVTVEKRHSNNITCRVQQRNTNQSRETHIHVPGSQGVLQPIPAVLG